MINRMWCRLKNMIKVGTLKSVDDSGDFRKFSVTVLGKAQPVLGFTQYGIMANPPADSLVILFNQNAQDSNMIGIADKPQDRTIKDLESGEVALSNYLTGSYIYFKSNGDIDFNVNGDLNLAASGDINLTAVNVSISSTTLSHNGKDIGENHTHPYTWTDPAGSGNTGGVN